MKTIIEYMQLCHIHFYQKIARKKVDRVNAALDTVLDEVMAKDQMSSSQPSPALPSQNMGLVSLLL